MAETNSNNETMEKLFTAIDTIVQKRIEKLPYDKTVIATIEDNTNAAQGKYVVNDGTSTYEAFSENTSYTIGQNVYVSIPQADYQQQKIITGKYIPNNTNTTAYNYVSPMNRFVDISGNLIDTIQSSWSLLANNISERENDGKEYIILWDSDVSLKGYDTIGLSAEFRSWLRNLEAVYGDYGLELNLLCKETTSQSNGSPIYYSFYLDSDDMSGDPYNYQTYFLQEEIYDISHIPQIDHIQLKFYQNKDFKNINKELIPTTFINGAGNSQFYDDNLFIQNPYLAVGYNLNNFSEDKVLLYSFNSNTYLNKITPEIKKQHPEIDFTKEINVHNFLEQLNQKTINLRWIHFLTEAEKSGNYNITATGITDNLAISMDEAGDLPEGAEIKWYHYDIKEENTENYDAAAGMFWEEIISARNQFQITVSPDIYTANEQYKVIIEYPSREYQETYIDNELSKQNGLYAQKEALFILNNNSVIQNQYRDGGQYLLELLDDTEQENLKIFQEDVKQVLANATTTTSEQELYLRTQVYNRDYSITQPTKRSIHYKLSCIAEDYPHLISKTNIGDRLIRAIDVATYENFIKDLQANFNTILNNVKTTYGESDAEYIRLLEIQRIKSQIDSLNNDIESFINTERANVKYYSSDIIVFTNEDKNVTLNRLELIKNLTLECDKEGLAGVYNIYDQSGYIKNEKDAKTERILVAKYNSINAGIENIDDVEQIQWKIPLINTMIQRPEEGIEYVLFEPSQIVVTADNYKSGIFYYYNENIDSIQPGGNYVQLTSSSSEAFNNSITYYVKNDTWYSESNGYAYIIRYGTKPINSNKSPELTIENTAEQYFRIKSIYSTNCINNTISCAVIKNNNTIEASTDLTFGPAGNNGTDYTFYLEFQNKAISLYASGFTQDQIDKNLHKITVVPRVFNYAGREITSEINNYTWSWEYSPTGGLITKENKTASVDLYSSVASASSVDMTKFCHYVLKCECKLNIVLPANANFMSYDNNNNLVNSTKTQAERTIALTAYLPIPVQIKYGEYGPDYIKAYDGNSLISYNNQGTDPYYYKDKFSLYYIDQNTKQIVQTLGRYNWFVEIKEGDGAKNYYPQITQDGYLTVPSLFSNGTGAVSLIVKDSSNSDQIAFILPIYIYKRVYQSSMLNSWDGSLTLNKNDGIILSTMMGAGYKDTQNRFYGVLMGDVSAVDADRHTAPSGTNLDSYYSGTGLYGFHEGQKSFGLNINGKAFLGKSGSGQILFDGNTGQITSANYLVNGVGGHIDVDNGIIVLKGPKTSWTTNVWGETVTQQTTQAYITLDPTPNPTNNNGDNPYFQIKSWHNIPLMHIGTSTYYLQSENFHTTKELGFKLDIQNGNIIAYNLNLKAGAGTRIFNLITNKDNFTLSASIQKHTYVSNTTDPTPVANQTIEVFKIIDTSSQHDFFLNSATWDATNHHGVRIDMKRGKITAYDEFVLNIEAFPRYFEIDVNKSSLKFRIGGQKQEVYFNYDQDDWAIRPVSGSSINLLYISDTTSNNPVFQLQSQTWDPTNHHGSQIDITKGKFTIYDNFSLRAFRASFENEDMYGIELNSEYTSGHPFLGIYSKGSKQIVYENQPDSIYTLQELKKPLIYIGMTQRQVNGDFVYDGEYYLQTPDYSFSPFNNINSRFNDGAKIDFKTGEFHWFKDFKLFTGNAINHIVLNTMPQSNSVNAYIKVRIPKNYSQSINAWTQFYSDSLQRAQTRYTNVNDPVWIENQRNQWIQEHGNSSMSLAIFNSYIASQQQIALTELTTAISNQSTWADQISGYTGENTAHDFFYVDPNCGLTIMTRHFTLADALSAPRGGSSNWNWLINSGTYAEDISINEAGEDDLEYDATLTEQQNIDRLLQFFTLREPLGFLKLTPLDQTLVFLRCGRTNPNASETFPIYNDENTSAGYMGNRILQLNGNGQYPFIIRGRIGYTNTNIVSIEGEDYSADIEKTYAYSNYRYDTIKMTWRGSIYARYIRINDNLRDSEGFNYCIGIRGRSIFCARYLDFKEASADYGRVTEDASNKRLRYVPFVDDTKTYYANAFKIKKYKNNNTWKTGYWKTHWIYNAWGQTTTNFGSALCDNGQNIRSGDEG